MNFINTERFRIKKYLFKNLYTFYYEVNLIKILIFSNNYFSFLLINLIKYSDSRKLYSF